LTKSDNYWGELNGVNGRFFGNGEHTLFLPVAGCRHNISGVIDFSGTIGYYWSNRIKDATAYRLGFNSTDMFMYSSNRCQGFSIRCVAE
jgi:hypothetical protein